MKSRKQLKHTLGITWRQLLDNLFMSLKGSGFILAKVKGMTQLVKAGKTL